MEYISNLNRKREKEELFIPINQENILIINNKFKRNNNRQIVYISLSKLLAIFAVVILHTNGAFWEFDLNNYKNYWISANLIESIFYYGVPSFVLCIGATLLDFNKRYGIKKYYKKRISKVVLPLFFWTFILYFYRVYFLKNLNNEKVTFEYLWNLYYSHKVYNIFGSLHDFLLLYMIIPLLAYVEKSKKIEIYFYCLIILLFFQIFFPYIIQIFSLNLTWIYSIKVGYLIYIFAGYIIHNYIFLKPIKLVII